MGFRSSRYEIIMSDQSEKGSSSEDHDKETKKNSANCGTSKTPLWRGGPDGPKSLCNACGIRSRKKRRAILGLNKGEDKGSKKGNSNRNCSSSNARSLGDLKQRLLFLGKEVLMQRSSKFEKQIRKLGEEEQAAVLLMALSYGSVYA